MSTNDSSQSNVANSGVANSNPALDFYRHFLPAISQKTGAIGAVAWDCSVVPYKVIGQYVDSGKNMQINLSEQEHLKLLERTNDGKQSVLFAETSSETAKQTVALSPVSRQGVSEIVEVVFDDLMSEEARKQVGGSLSSYCLAADQLAARAQAARAQATSAQATGAPAQTAADAASGPSNNFSALAIDRFARSVHRSLDLKTTSYEVANEMQTMVDCDRVAVLRNLGDRWKAIAFSGQAELAARSNTIRALESLVKNQAAKGDLWLPRDSESVAAEVEESLNIYRTHSSFRELAIVPLRESVAPPSQPPTPGMENQEPAEGEVFGALVIEQFDDRPLESRQQGIELLAQHAASALENSIAHQDLPFFGLVNRLGGMTAFRARSRRNKLLVALGVIALVGLLLSVIPVQFKIMADGVLLPEQRRNVFAEVDGEVTEIAVKHGQEVAKGDPLIFMRSDQLKIYLEDLDGKIKTTRKQIQAIDQARMKADQRGVDSSQVSMLNVEREKLDASLKTLLEEKIIADERAKKLNIVSPIDGQVLSWELDYQLEDRPTTRGQRLMEIGNLQGPWIVELDLPDRDAGKVLVAQSKSKDPLKVTFIIASDPGKSFTGYVAEIAEATTADPVAGQTVRVKVKIDKSDLDFRQVRTDVRARIHCGRASLGYVWLHDLVEFVQSKVLFRIF